MGSRRRSCSVAALAAALLAAVLLMGAGPAPTAPAPRAPAPTAPGQAFPAPPPSLLPELPILTYHRVCDSWPWNDGGRTMPVAEFAAQLAYLEGAGFTTVHLAEWLEMAAHRRPVPERPVALTFDDGYRDNALEAYPLLKRAGLKATFFVVAGRTQRQGHMTWDILRRLDPAVVEVGSHTWSHAAVPELNRRGLGRELIGSRRALERELGRPVTVFSYPFGLADDRSRRAVERAGYGVACTTERRRARLDDDPRLLPRMTVPRGMSLAAFARMVGGPPPTSAPPGPGT